jgi:hypothetical protein
MQAYFVKISHNFLNHLSQQSVNYFVKINTKNISKICLLAFTFICVHYSLVTGNEKPYTQIGPGVRYFSETLPWGPVQVFVAEIDLQNPHLSIESILAHDRLAGLERSSDMLKRQPKEKGEAIVAINGDFFQGNGYPVNAQVIEGELVKRPHFRSVFALTPDNKPFIDRLIFDALLINKGDTIQINGLNEQRRENDLILYNQWFGPVTRTNRWGSEAILSLVNGHSTVNKPFRAVVQSMMIIDSSSAGNTLIPPKHIILSGHGEADLKLKKYLNLGDTVEIQLMLKPLKKELKTLIGGTPRLIRNGKITNEWEQEALNESFSATRHPRTALGINADSTRLYFLVADGRQPGYSEGMSLPELAEYLLTLGIHETVNLDGGGSSSFLRRAEIVNRPSDYDGERSVANMLAVFNQSPKTRTAKLLIKPPQISTVIQSPFRFSVTAVDSNFHYHALENADFSLEYDSALVKRNESGEWILKGGPSPQWIKISYDGISQSLPIYTEIIEYLESNPEKIQLYTKLEQQIKVKAMNKTGEEIQVTPNIYHWEYNKADIEISETGIIKALQPSQGEIILRSNQSSLKIPYQIFTPDTILYDYFSVGESFDLKPVNGEIQSFQMAENILRCNYLLLNKGKSFLYLNRAQTLPSHSTALLLDIEANPLSHGLRIAFQDSKKHKFFSSLDEKLNPEKKNWQTVHISLDKLIPQWSNPGVKAEAPLTLLGFYLFQGDEQLKGTGSLAMRQMRTIQPMTTLTVKNYQMVCETELALLYSDAGLQLIKNNGTNIEELALVNIKGEIVHHSQINSRHYLLSRYETLDEGVYILFIRCQDKFILRKIVRL